MATRCGAIGTIVMRLPSGEELMALENPFVWHELVTSDQKSSGDFFARLFGWARREVDAGPFGTYTLFQVNESDIAGMMNPTSDSPAGGSYWHTYFAVSDPTGAVAHLLQTIQSRAREFAAGETALTGRGPSSNAGSFRTA